MKNALIGCVLVALTGAAAPLSAQTTDLERAQAATATRQGLLKVVVSYFGPIVGMARGQIPYDGAVVAANAAKISTLLPMIPDVFRHDTRAFDVETGARDAIWDNPDDIRTKAGNATEAALALEAAAGQGQEQAMKAFQQLGGACKACHDEYRDQD
jgi:cytochrome c556